ncbi:MAG: FAD:protein FMN transferase [Prevotella sp.]|nr:FAD:protein FMN transferase [Prevotella sp.]
MDKKRKNMWQLAFLAFLIIATVLIIRHQQDMPYQQDSGMVFGTVYHITYQSDRSLKKEIEAELQKVDDALSPFNSQSIISHINRNEDTQLNNMFIDVFEMARQISEETDGAFDITVAPLVNAWGFGFKAGTAPTQHAIDSLKSTVGYKKVSLSSGRIHKTDPRVMLDCSAIAKGYGSDVVARLLKKEGIQNYMVEIGGEIVTSGINQKRERWRIGVTKPSDDSLSVNQELQTVLNVTDKAMATSGNYRNFYYKNGRKYAHTIDPKTGYPVQHSILSATVIAPSCAIADAYATSFMVMGMERARQVLEKHPELMAYLIYTDEKGDYAVWYSPKLEPAIGGD